MAPCRVRPGVIRLSETSISGDFVAPPFPTRVAGLRGLLVPSLAVALAVTALWAGGASYFLLSRDGVVARFAREQRAMQTAYDERVGALHQQIDRAASERGLTRDRLEDRLAALAERQALLEKRQGRLSSLSVSVTGSIAAPSPAELPQAKPAPVQKVFPLPELRMRGEDRSEAPDHRHAAHLAGLESRLDGLGEQQHRVLSGITAQSLRNAESLRLVIARAGLKPARYERPEPGIGGPLVPVSADAFEIAVAEAERAANVEERLRRAVAKLPFRKPLRDSFVYSSEFGTRLDPFTRGFAMHTGLDMRADHGALVRATAAGRVTAAEPAGGYGNMVEIEHGQGLATRYAHLSAYAVAPGQWVEAGTILGRVGSTGRSTGNHLHYETRVDGEPVDPQPFLRAGAALDAAAPAER